MYDSPYFLYLCLEQLVYPWFTPLHGQMLINSFVVEITYLNVVGQEAILLLNSSKAAVDLLDKRSPICSDRPVRMMAGEMIDGTLVIMKYSSRFREIRKCTNF